MLRLFSNFRPYIAAVNAAVIAATIILLNTPFAPLTGIVADVVLVVALDGVLVSVYSVPDGVMGSAVGDLVGSGPSPNEGFV